MMPGTVRTTGELIPADTAALAEVRRIRVEIGGEGEIAVLLNAARGGVTGWLLLGVIGSRIEMALRAADDREEARKLAAALEGWNPLLQLEQSLVSSLRSTGSFENVVGTFVPEDAGRTEVVDGVLYVDIRHFGLRPALGEKRNDDYVQAAIDLTVSIFSNLEEDPLWSWRDIYSYGEEKPFDAYRAQPTLLRRELEASVEEVAIRVRNSVRLVYP